MLLQKLIASAALALATVAASADAVTFSRAFGVPADGSWDGLFSSDNKLDAARYALEEPEGTIFWPVSMRSVPPLRERRSGTELLPRSGVTGPTFPCACR